MIDLSAIVAGVELVLRLPQMVRDTRDALRAGDLRRLQDKPLSDYLSDSTRLQRALDRERERARRQAGGR